MASIHPTRYGTFEVKWRENGHPKSETKKTQGEAEALRSRVEARLAGGRIVVRSKDAPTLEDFAAAWLASRKGLEPTTKALYTELLEVHILPILGHLSIPELKPRRLQEWQDTRLAEGAGPAVLGKAQTLLGQILNKAILPYEYLDANPVDALEKPEYEKRVHRWLTAGDVEALRLWFLDHDDLGSATLVSVLAYVGIRPQDALARSWSDLGTDNKLAVTTKNVNGEIRDGSKTGTSYKRRVRLPEMVVADLEEWRLATRGTGLIFPRAKDGLPWTKTDWSNWRSRHPKGKKRKRPRCFKAAAESIGANLRPYDLRHTAASLMAAAGWTAVEIAHQLGHSPTESQRTYQHLIHEDRRDRGSVDQYIREARGLSPVRDSFGVAAR